MKSNGAASSTPQAPFYFPDLKHLGMFAGKCLDVLALTEPKIFTAIKKFDCCPEALQHLDFISAAGENLPVKSICTYCGHPAQFVAFTALGKLWCCADKDCLDVLQDQYKEHSLYDLKLSSVYMFEEDYQKEFLTILRLVCGLPQNLKPGTAFQFWKDSYQKSLVSA
ncbi:MAG: hypothetical protein WC453_03370 [Patescibacteria group bacterium]